MVIPIWVGDAQMCKRLYLQFFHRAGIFRGGLVIVAGKVKQGARLRVATKYVNIAREFFAEKGVHVDIIKLYGSMELAPLTGLADAIVDLVSTGSTLKANHLVEVERILDVSARLVVNQAALKLKREPLRKLIDAFARAAG